MIAIKIAGGKREEFDSKDTKKIKKRYREKLSVYLYRKIYGCC